MGTGAQISQVLYPCAKCIAPCPPDVPSCSDIKPREFFGSSNPAMAWQTIGSCQPYTEVQQMESLFYHPPTLDLNESFSSGIDGVYSSIFTRHRESVSSSSGSSISELPSPTGRRDSTSTAHSMSVDTNSGPEFSDQPWNLVAYHVPWGPVYEGYETGALPGPGGDCIFLRSPTPLKRQRTSQACEKCRERKAKVRTARARSAQGFAQSPSCFHIY
jgi:hypothetical protein